MSDWQIKNLLCEQKAEEKEVKTYDEIFWHVYRLRGYSDSEIETIHRWKMVDGLDDKELYEKMRTTGILRE